MDIYSEFKRRTLCAHVAIDDDEDDDGNGRMIGSIDRSWNDEDINAGDDSIWRQTNGR